MKKLSELSLDELKSLYDKNGDFKIALWEGIQEAKTFLAQNVYDCIFDKDARGFSSHKHYDSFYYRLDDAEAFLNGLKSEAKHYMTADGAKKFEEVMKKFERWQNMTWEEQDENQKLYDEIEDGAKEILQQIEDELKSYDEITDEDVEEELENIIDGYSGIEEYETDGEKIYFTINRVWK